MLIMNTLKHALPHKVPMKHADVRDRAMLQYRRHEPLSSPKSLTPEEADRLRAYDGAMWLERAPRWDGHDFKFAAAGEQGCVYNLPPDVATFLAEKYNQGSPLICEMETEVLLKIIPPSEVPEGVTPIQPDLNDPLAFSSESFRARGADGQLVTVSAGYAPPPEKVNINDPRVAAQLAVPSSAITSTPTASASLAAARAAQAAAASPNEPQLKK